MAIDEAVNYHLLLKYPDRSEPENADFTSFTGELKEGDTFSPPEKGEWRRSGGSTTVLRVKCSTS